MRQGSHPLPDAGRAAGARSRGPWPGEWHNRRIAGTMVLTAVRDEVREVGVDDAGPQPTPVPEWTAPSWDDVVRTHSARVYRLAYRLTGNQHDAEDLTQEVFVRVFRSLSSYTPGTFEGWLHRITTNLFLDGARRRQRIRFEGLSDEVAQRLPGAELTPAQAWDERHLDGDILEGVRGGH